MPAFDERDHGLTISDEVEPPSPGIGNVTADHFSKALSSLSAEHLKQCRQAEKGLEEQLASASQAFVAKHTHLADVLARKALALLQEALGRSGATTGAARPAPSPKLAVAANASANDLPLGVLFDAWALPGATPSTNPAAEENGAGPAKRAPPIMVNGHLAAFTAASPRPSPRASPRGAEEHLAITPLPSPRGGKMATLAVPAPHSTNFDGHGDLREKVRRNQSKRAGGMLMMPPPREDKAAMTKKAVFVDADAMKEKVRAAIGQKEYNVIDCYKDIGWAQAIARDPRFEQVTLGVITINALWIGIDTDHNKSQSILDADVGFKLAENLFCAYFFFEVIVRACAFRALIKDGLRDAWFIFDGALAMLMVFETWVMYGVIKISSAGSQNTERMGNAAILKLLRLVRLFRMGRMARLLRAVPELMILVKGMAVATRSVFFTLCLLMILLYVFGVAFAQTTMDTSLGEEYFDGVLDSMNTLLLHGTLLEDCPDVINACGDEHPVLRLLFLFFILLASLTVMNMLVGVLVEVVSVVSSVEKEAMQVSFVKERLTAIVEKFKLDADDDHNISKEEFELLLANPDAARILSDVGVDVIGLVDYHDFIFQDDAEFNFVAFVELILSLRGGNTATVKDIVDLRKFLIMELNQLQALLSAFVAKNQP